MAMALAMAKAVAIDLFQQNFETKFQKDPPSGQKRNAFVLFLFGRVSNLFRCISGQRTPLPTPYGQAL